MPIYEFYCKRCNTLFSFLSRKVSPATLPPCPRCKKNTLQRQVSMFAAVGRAKENGEGGDEKLPFDETKMEGAMEALAGEAENVSEEDPRQVAGLMRKFSKMSGMELGGGMQEALKRLESGEDPDQIEAELGDRLEQEEPFAVPGQKSQGRAKRRPPPRRDETLYEM
jgi:putative FmdB family regulatory protein